jgi:radical SAM superfamily enzyme YgiQ (UPF0313 family)
MRVILVQAPARNLKFNIGAHFKILPLGLAYLAGALRKSGIDLEVFFPADPKALSEKFESFLDKTDSPCIIGISATLFAVREAFKLARAAKRVNPANIVVIGGQCTALSAEAFFRYCEDIDYVVSGEGETAFASLVGAIQNKASTEGIANVSFKTAEGVRSCGGIVYEDLDSLGFPLRDIFPARYHVLHPPMGRYSPAYLVETMRGCSYRCSFCSIGNNLRLRSVDSVMEELRMLKGGFRAKEVYFVDPTFTIDRDRAYKLCTRMIAERVGLKWTCMTRVDCVDAELLRVMKESGCYLIHFGVESASADILKEVNKGQSAEQTVLAFDACRKCGIGTGAFVILGSTKYDSESTLLESVRLIKRIRPTYVLYDHIKPIPNGHLVLKAIENKIISRGDVEEFYLGDRNNSRLSRETLCGIPLRTAKGWVRSSSQSFYLSPANIFNIVRGLKTKNDFLNLCRASVYYLREMGREDGW